MTKHWVIDWLLTTKVLSVYSGRGSKMMICPTCPSYFTMATQIRSFYHRSTTMSLFTLQISTFLKKCYNWPWQLVLTHNVNAMVGRVCNTDTEYRKPVLSSIPNTGTQIQGIPVFQSPKYGIFLVKFTSKL